MNFSGFRQLKNPFKLSRTKNYPDFLDWEEIELGLHDAAQSGDMDLIQYCESRGASFWAAGLDGAIVCQDETKAIELITYFEGKGLEPPYCSWAFLHAAWVGRLELVKYFEVKCFQHNQSIDWNKGLECIVQRKHEDVLEYFLSKGADRDLVNQITRDFLIKFHTFGFPMSSIVPNVTHIE